MPCLSHRDSIIQAGFVAAFVERAPLITLDDYGLSGRGKEQTSGMCGAVSGLAQVLGVWNVISVPR